MTVKYHFNCYCSAIPVPATAKERIFTLSFILGRSCSLGIANRYGLDGPGIDYRWRPGVPPPSRPAARPTNFYTMSFPRLKGPGRGLGRPLPCNAKVKERVEL